MEDQPEPVGASKIEPGSVDAACVHYYASTAFKRLAPATQQVRRRQLERFRKDYGPGKVATLTSRIITQIVEKRESTPAEGNNLLKVLRQVLEVAVQRGMRKDNPAKEVKRLPERNKSHERWSDADKAAFKAHHPSGTKARLAYALFVTTGLRRSDIVRIGWDNVRSGRIKFDQKKTGKPVNVPIQPELLAELENAPRDQPTFIQTDYGKPFTPDGFGQWFGERAQEAGLTGRTAHGLRHDLGSTLAESGVSQAAIAAVLGHASPAETARYTKQADGGRMSDEAFAAYAAKSTPSGKQGT
ncbi:tyrosine-type recombinase/integrase [Roseomonas sp. WA12]